MRGTIRKISIPRRLIDDMMHASIGVPFVSLRRNLDISRLLEARALAAQPPGWAAIFVKAFGLVAQEQPVLRTLYARWPWPHFYELPRSIGMVAIARVENGEDCVLPQKVSLDDPPQSLAEIDRLIRFAKDAPVSEVGAFCKMLRAAALPLPLRRLVWLFGLNVARQRANYFGSFGVTSVAAYGPGELHALSPGPYILSYGTVTPDRTIDVLIRWDHRVTDGALIAKALTRLEQVLNTEIAAELRSQRPLAQVRAVAT
ncbi:acyltransferase [Bradyrhizobium sp. dw_78]|uniref:acyltransferase n=1 Tax=Bradyrhizobium sp. dw_78 TaxID=2719793 RepID=UPI001BD1F95D|nr:acyltransferase [Bradyrhizobium sp. dw_78]